jgi:hypothetical protein
MLTQLEEAAPHAGAQGGCVKPVGNALMLACLPRTCTPTMHTGLEDWVFCGWHQVVVTRDTDWERNIHFDCLSAFGLLTQLDCVVLVCSLDVVRCLMGFHSSSERMGGIPNRYVIPGALACYRSRVWHGRRGLAAWWSSLTLP